jgi:hypothetical protein
MVNSLGPARGTGLAGVSTAGLLKDVGRWPALREGDQRGVAIEDRGDKAGRPPTFFRNYAPGVRTGGPAKQKNRDAVNGNFQIDLTGVR